MPVTPTYPGVYIEEIPSGVRTITGVSTSVTAFLGAAKRGPLNKPVRLFSFADFERRFGGLAADSEMSYAVRQFFLNGGSEAWVVRLAKATSAFLVLQNEDKNDVLKVSALEEGFSGNNIEVRVDYQTGNPDSTFNLTLIAADPDNPAGSQMEKFTNLTMNSKDQRYVGTAVNGVSKLVTVENQVTQLMIDNLDPGASLSGELTEGGNLVDVATLVDATHNQFQISVNGSKPVTVQINPADVTGADNLAKLTTLCEDLIQPQITALAGSNPVFSNFSCTVDHNKIKMQSGVKGEDSSVRVSPGLSQDLAGRLKLGLLGGGQEVDAAAALRPLQIPDRAVLISEAFGNTDLDGLPDANANQFLLSLDGYGPDPVYLGTAALTGADLAEKLKKLAVNLQGIVQGLKPANPAYKGFSCEPDDTQKKLQLFSGSRGKGSGVAVFKANSKDIAAQLHLLGVSGTKPENVTLQGAKEEPYKEDYNLFIGDRSQRQGIYALEGVDLFNILCLPGVSDPGILMDAAAYCQERRAFFIIDAPRGVSSPDDMEKSAQGTQFPKTEYAAVYFPWVKIGDPLAGGKLRATAPCGTVAGVYARTDGARGVWKAPAGTDATLAGVQGLDYALTNQENGVLNPLGVNCLRLFPVYGPVSWGARTLRGADQMTSEYKYVPVRRLALYLEESLYRGTQWVVFEPNDEPLWAQIRLNVGAFMHTLFRQGAFQGSSPREAYFVKCDKETTTQDDINRGVVNILVGFAPLKPAEFVIIQIQQIAGQIAA